MGLLDSLLSIHVNLNSLLLYVVFELSHVSQSGHTAPSDIFFELERKIWLA